MTCVRRQNRPYMCHWRTADSYTYFVSVIYDHYVGNWASARRIRAPMSDTPLPYVPLAPPVASPNVPLGLILAIACGAQFMVVLDGTIVNVALPSMRADLGLSVNAQQWVVDGYLITFGGLLLLAARASDLFGRKWVFQCGLIVFILASLVGGFADTGGMLLTARIVQGIGAAALAPASLSLITASHTDPHERTRALAIWSAVVASAGGIGLVLGGILTTELSWRWVLFVNVPIGAFLLFGATVSLLPGKPARGRPRLDVPGALTITMGMGTLVYGISVATEKGWGSAPVVTALVAAAVLLAGFVYVEHTSTQPLFPLAIFKHRNIRTGNVLMITLGVTGTTAFFFVSLYLQEILGESALRTGLSIMPMIITNILFSFVSRQLIPLVGPRLLLVTGPLIVGAGMAWISRLPTESSFVLHVLGPMLVIGSGVGLMVLPMTMAATTGVAPRNAGLASGLLNMGRQIGGALGLAVMVTVAASITNHSGHHSADAILRGYRAAFLIAAGVCVLGACTALFLEETPMPTSNSELAEAEAKAKA
jgi:EmrB/QacA subfamily drug resistance transporter